MVILNYKSQPYIFDYLIIIVKLLSRKCFLPLCFTYYVGLVLDEQTSGHSTYVLIK